MKLKIQLLENDCWYDLINLNPLQFRIGQKPVMFNSLKQAHSVLSQLVKDGCKADELRYISCDNPSARPRIYPAKFKKSMTSLGVPKEISGSVKDVAIALAWGEYDDAIALLTKLKETERTQIHTE